MQLQPGFRELNNAPFLFKTWQLHEFLCVYSKGVLHIHKKEQLCVLISDWQEKKNLNFPPSGT